jgi:hypothetical protein
MNLKENNTNKKPLNIALIVLLIVLFLEAKLILLGLKDPSMWTSIVVSSFQILIVAAVSVYCIKKN